MKLDGRVVVDEFIKLGEPMALLATTLPGIRVLYGDW
jgi:hypothetical protein